MFYKSRSTVGCATRHSSTTTTTTTTAMTPNPELDHVINNGIESGFFRDNEFAILSVQHQDTSTEGAHRGIRDSESFWCSPTSSAQGTLPLSIRGSALPGSFFPNLGSIPHTPTRPSAAQQSQGCSHENSYASSWCSCYSHSSALESTNGRPSTAGTGHSITIVNTRPIAGILGTASTNSPIVPTFGSVSAMLAKPPRPPFHRNPPVPFPRFGIRRPSTSPTPAIGLRGLSPPPPRPRNRLVPTARATAVIRPHTAPAVKATVFVELYRSED
ncbi:hypothetical protein FRC16_005400 [Serendipita sp. 398]|nr:hypothetical protein FRC16_005400 [Serendipita sp. 398]